jgi:hypothetical protein
MPLEPVTTTAGLVKTAVELLKSARSLAQKIKNAELNDKLMELQTVMLELQGKLSGLQVDNEALRDEVRALREQIALKDSLVFDAGDYWLDGDHGRVGPFCSRCFDVDGKAVRMHPGRTGSPFCPECILGRKK